MRKFFWFILLLVVFSGLVQISFAGNKKFCKIGGKKINVGDITLSTDFFPEKKYVIATAQYTFYLDSNALRIDMKNIDRYLHSKNSYYVMAAILLQYVNTVYPDKPCPQGRKVCSKEVCLSVNNFFEYLNNNPEIKKNYLMNCISRTLFAPRYKNLDYFLLQRTREVAYAFYGISYLESDVLLNRTLIDKMVISIMTNGNVQDISPDYF